MTTMHEAAAREKAAASDGRLDFRRFSDGEGVVDFNPKISHSAFKLGMAEKQLDGT